MTSFRPSERMAWNTPLNPAREAELEYEERCGRTTQRRLREIEETLQQSAGVELFQAYRKLRESA